MKQRTTRSVTAIAATSLRAVVAAGLLTTAPLSLVMAQATSADTAGKAATSNTAFIKDAIEGNMAEVKLGQLAQQKSSNSQVKQFGMMLEKDHGAANDQAKQAAQTMGVAVPTEPNKMQQHTYDKLSKLSGDSFDKEFAKDMVDDHQKDVQKYEMAAKKSDAAGTYAQQTLPKLREHLKMAESLKK